MRHSWASGLPTATSLGAKGLASCEALQHRLLEVCQFGCRWCIHPGLPLCCGRVWSSAPRRSSGVVKLGAAVGRCLGLMEGTRMPLPLRAQELWVGLAMGFSIELCVLGPEWGPACGIEEGRGRQQAEEQEGRASGRISRPVCVLQSASQRKQVKTLLEGSLMAGWARGWKLYSA